MMSEPFGWHLLCSSLLDYKAETRLRILGRKSLNNRFKRETANFFSASNMWLSWKQPQTGQRAHMDTCYAVISNQSGQLQKKKKMNLNSIHFVPNAEDHDEELKERTNT